MPIKITFDYDQQTSPFFPLLDNLWLWLSVSFFLLFFSQEEVFQTWVCRVLSWNMDVCFYIHQSLCYNERSTSGNISRSSDTHTSHDTGKKDRWHEKYIMKISSFHVQTMYKILWTNQINFCIFHPLSYSSNRKEQITQNVHHDTCFNRIILSFFIQEQAKWVYIFCTFLSLSCLYTLTDVLIRI